MFGEFVGLAKEFGSTGLMLALVIFVLVYVARMNGLVVNGKWARVANIVLSSVLSGLDPLNPQAEEALVAVIASLGSALLYEFIQFASKKMEEQKKTPEKIPATGTAK